MNVIYPEDLRLTEGQHQALAAQDLHAQNGELTEDGMAQAQAFHDANALALEQSTVKEEAAPAKKSK